MSSVADALATCCGAFGKKNVLVSGANKGIGLAIVKALAKKGMFVFLGSRDIERGNAAKQSLVDEDARAEAMIEVVQLDVTSKASIDAAVETVKESLGPGEFLAVEPISVQ